MPSPAIYSTPKFQRPNASFVLNAQEFIIWSIGRRASCVGRIFAQILKAVDDRDEAFLSQYSRFIGRVYWREKSFRPTLPDSLKREVFRRDGRACVQCCSDYKLEIDHIIPFSKGGKHALDNLRVLCKPCNRRKGASMPVEA